MSKYMVITNNPLVRSRLDDTHEVIYLELSYEELLRFWYVRNFKIKVSITKKKFIRIFNWLTGLY